MKKRNRIPLILVILLGSISFWLVINNKKGTIKETLRDFAVADTGSITKIFLADKNNRTITLDRQSDGSWRLNDKFTARRDAIQNLLYTIKKVDVKEPVGKKAHDNIVKQLSGSSIKCEIYQGNKLAKAYYVGTETQDQTGTYMILIDPETMKTSASPFVTYIPGFEGYLTTRYFTDEKGWRDIRVFNEHPQTIQTVKLEIPFNPSLGYQVNVKGPNLYEVKHLTTQQPLESLDTLAVKQFLSYFQNLNFESFEDQLNEKQTDSVLNSQPLNVLSVTGKDGRTKSVKFFARFPKKRGEKDVNGKEILFDQERMDASIDNSRDLVIVQYYVFGKAMPPIDYFKRK